MAIKANQFSKSITNDRKKKPEKKPKNKGGSSFRGFFNLFRDERFVRIFGLFLVLTSFFLLVAFISNFFTWAPDHFIAEDHKTANWTGKAGRWAANLLVNRGFGAGAFAFPFLFFVYGMKLLFGKSVFPLLKTTLLSLVALIWLSVTSGFLFGNHQVPWVAGGVFGIQIAGLMEQGLAKVGTALALLFVLLSLFLYALPNPLRWFSAMFEQSKKKPSARQKVKEDIYNTIEFAVDDEPLQEEEPEKVEEEVSEDVDLDLVENSDDGKGLNQEKSPDIELVIEQPVHDEEVIQETKNGEAVGSLDSEYDPKLDLPHYKNPEIKQLDDYGSDTVTVNKEELERNKTRIVDTLGNYSIDIQQIKATIGPTVTLYEIVPSPGVRISKIKNLEDDIALSLSALGIRIIAPIPGKGTIGIEVPNENPEIVSLRSVLGSEKFKKSTFELPFAIGRTISNETYVADLTKMPHILMAGATGQGKSVGLNVIIASLLYRKHPAEIKFILVDPKKVELNLYSKIERHFLAKLPDSEEAIITDTRKVVRTLNSLCLEMDNRYELLKDAQVRNIKEYNEKFRSRRLNPLHGHRFLPYFVLVVDEFADLIMTAGKEIEGPITRLAQLARAVGIHLIIATQRPSVNIITGSIKANFPARIAFRVISKIDSRTILDSSGADQLIGRGDMLFSTGNDLLRLQCAFVDTPELERITEFIGSQRAYPDAYYLPDYQDEESLAVNDFDPNQKDELFEEAARIIVQTQQGSTSLLQRKLKLGYNRAGRIIDQLEAAGIVGPFEGSKAREVKIASEMALEQFLKDKML